MKNKKKEYEDYKTHQEKFLLRSDGEDDGRYGYYGRDIKIGEGCEGLYAIIPKGQAAR